MKNLFYSFLLLGLLTGCDRKDDSPSGPDLTTDLLGVYEADSAVIGGQIYRAPIFGYDGSITVARLTNEQIEVEARLSINGQPNQSKVPPLDVEQASPPGRYLLKRNGQEVGHATAKTFYLNETFSGIPITIYASRD